MTKKELLIKEFCTGETITCGTNNVGISGFSMFFDNVEEFVSKYNNKYKTLISKKEVVTFFIYYVDQYKNAYCDGYTMFCKQPKENSNKLDDHIYIGEFYGVEF